MAVAIELQDGDVLMAGDLHHAAEVGVFFVTAEHFEFAIAGDQEEGRSVFADVVEGGEFIDDGAGVGNATLLSDREMSNGVTAEGDESGETVGVNAMEFEVGLIESDHGGEVAAGGVAAEENEMGRTAISGDVMEDPGDGSGAVFDIGG